jgi:hypothetical protein
MRIFNDINYNKTFISTTITTMLFIFTTTCLLFFVSGISHQTFAQEGNTYEGLDIKLKYFDPWQIGTRDDDSSCIDLCLTGLNTPNFEAMIMISQEKFDSLQIKNECKCDTLLEYAKYKFQISISKNEDLVFVNDNQTTLTDENISAIQMELENKGDTTTVGDTGIYIFLKGPNSFYNIIFSADKNEQYSKYLDDFNNIINSIEFVSINETITNKPKLPSFMTTNDTKEEENQIALQNQQETKDQQQLSGLMIYNDPKGRFTLEYDPSLWIAIPDRNRFDEIEVTFADKETGGKDVGVTIAIVKDPLPDLSIKEQTEIALPGYLGNNEYEDRQLEEGVECVKITIQGYDTCSFILSFPKSYFDTYPRIYSMIASAKIGDELWLVSFNAPGGKFEEFEQSVMQMINSMKIITSSGQTTTTTTTDLASSSSNSIRNNCNPIHESTITLQNTLNPKGVLLLSDFSPCKLVNGEVTLNIPENTNLKLTAMYVDPIGNEHSGAFINPTNIQSNDKNHATFTIKLDKTMKGTDPITGKSTTLTKINGLALYNNGDKPIVFQPGNIVTLTAATFTK